MLEETIPEGLSPVERTHVKAVFEELQPGGRVHTGEGHEGLFPVVGTPFPWSRGRV